MSLKHTWTQSIKDNAGAVVANNDPIEILGEGEVRFDELVPAGGDTLVELAVDVSEIKSGYLYADKADCTVKTNAADGSGGQVIALTAKRAKSWHNLSGFTNPFTPDITKFYLYNDGDEDARIRGAFLVGTPE